MSAVLCSECKRLFSSDDDPDCFVEVGNMRRMNWTVILCEPCREERARNSEREIDDRGLAP